LRESGGRLRIEVDATERAAVLADLAAPRASAPSAPEAPPDLAEVDRRATGSLQTIAGLGGDTSDEEIAAALHELELLVHEGEPQARAVAAAVQRLVDRRALVGTRAAAVRMVLWQDETDRLLRRLARLASADEQAIAAEVARASALAQELQARAENDDERNAAERLSERTKALEAEHAKARRIAALGPLELTAVFDNVTDRRGGDEPERAILNGVAVKVGDPVPSADGKPIADSRVLRIGDRAVWLTIGDLSFGRDVEGE
jgi:hypothetical protein